MAGKYDKLEGVFLIQNKRNKMIYVGKSTKVGVAIRSAKSKLNKGKFHNHKLQIDYNKFGFDGFHFLDPILVIDEDGFNLRELYDDEVDAWIKEEYILYNDVQIIKTEKEVVRDRIMELDDDSKQDIVERILDAFENDEFNTPEFSQKLYQMNI